MRREPKETEAGQGHPGFFSSFPQFLKGECAILASGSQPGSTPPLGLSRVGVEVLPTTGSCGVGPAGHMEGPLAPGELLCQGLGPPRLRPHLPLCICPGWGLRGRQPGCSLPSAGAYGENQTEASRVPAWALPPTPTPRQWHTPSAPAPPAPEEGRCLCTFRSVPWAPEAVAGLRDGASGKPGLPVWGFSLGPPPCSWPPEFGCV